MALLLTVTGVMGCMAEVDEIGSAGEPSSKTTCGGIAGKPCPGNLVCVDDPSDKCDPKHGGADCIGICVAPPPPKHCGGFAGIPCPSGLVCVDDPSDTCDPAHGGADCIGICVAP